MKFKLLAFLLVSLLANVVVAQKVIYVDVKTPFMEKTDLSVPKAGTIFFVGQSSDFGLREAGEDFSFWLTDYQASQEGKQVTIRIKVELRTPSMLRHGKLLAQKEIKIAYKTDEILPPDEASLFERFKTSVRKIKSEVMLEGFYTGRACFEALKDMVNEVQ